MAINHVLYQHKPNIDIGHFDKLYEKNLAWCTRGIAALRHAEVNPFHVSICDRDENSPVAVYCLVDHNSNEEHYWFEDDYKAAFEAFRERKEPHDKYSVMLFVATLKPKGSAKETFLYHDPFGSEHTSTCHWMDEYQSWQF